MSHQIVRHELDKSPPRVSDLDLEAQRRELLSRAQRRRDAWLHNRRSVSLGDRLLSVFRSAALPSVADKPGAGSSHPLGAGALSPTEARD